MFRRSHALYIPLLESLSDPVFLFGKEGELLHSTKNTLALFDASQNVKSKKDLEAALYNRRIQDSPPIYGIDGHNYGHVTQYFKSYEIIRLVPALRPDNNDVHIMLENLPFGIMLIQREGDCARVKAVNTQCGTMLGIPRDNMLLQDARHIFRVFGIEEDFTARLFGVATSKADYQGRCEARFVCYEITFLPSQDAKGPCVILFEDQTEKKVVENRQLQTERLEALAQLAGGIAHDFNNLLSIIDGYTRIARKAVSDRPETDAHLERIMQSVQRGAALTAQLLTFGKHRVVKESVTDLGQLARDQESLIRPLMDRNVTISIRAEDEIFVDAGADQLCQILINLCINARDAMPDGGNIIIEAAGNGDSQASLRVIDTGTGMDAATKAHMFDPFFTTKGQGKGTGLGLSLVYGMVREMNGTVEVDTRLGSGTVMTILLPRSLKAPRKTIEHVEDGMIQLKGYTALVAEDEPDLLRLVTSMLEDMGLTVLPACNGNEALALQDDYDGKIDFLLTDVVMPEMNGVKLAELFGSIRPDSRIMFMSGYPANGQMARVQVPEGALLMPKPVDFEKLNQILSRLARNENEVVPDDLRKMTGQWRMRNGRS